jgi:hypothetical protein
MLVSEDGLSVNKHDHHDRQKGSKSGLLSHTRAERTVRSRTVGAARDSCHDKKLDPLNDMETKSAICEICTIRVYDK